jgi:hypothetical protein
MSNTKKSKKNTSKHTPDTSQGGEYKLTEVIKMSKGVLDVLLVLICYQYMPEIRRLYPVLYTLHFA